MTNPTVLDSVRSMLLSQAQKYTNLEKFLKDHANLVQLLNSISDQPGGILFALAVSVEINAIIINNKKEYTIIEGNIYVPYELEGMIYPN